MKSVPLYIAADHPAFAGHFPGAPVLPGVLLLDAAVQSLSDDVSHASQHWQIAHAKFQSAAQPGETLWLEHEALGNGSVRFAIRTADRAIASGMLTPLAVARDADAV
jgi:3-hydroxyacyl-[acyl-carrier-protein] dehydratase